MRCNVFSSFFLSLKKTYLKNIWRHRDAVVRPTCAARFEIDLRRLLKRWIVKSQIDTRCSTVTTGSTRGSTLDLLRLLTSGWARALQRNSRWWDWRRGQAEVAGLNGRGCGLSVVQWIVTATSWCRFLRFRGRSETKFWLLIYLQCGRIWVRSIKSNNFHSYFITCANIWLFALRQGSPVRAGPMLPR